MPSFQGAQLSSLPSLPSLPSHLANIQSIHRYSVNLHSKRSDLSFLHRLLSIHLSRLGEIKHLSVSVRVLKKEKLRRYM